MRPLPFPRPQGASRPRAFVRGRSDAPARPARLNRHHDAHSSPKAPLPKANGNNGTVFWRDLRGDGAGLGPIPCRVERASAVAVEVANAHRSKESQRHARLERTNVRRARTLDCSEPLGARQVLGSLARAPSWASTPRPGGTRLLIVGAKHARRSGPVPGHQHHEVSAAQVVAQARKGARVGGSTAQTKAAHQSEGGSGRGGTGGD